MQNAFPSQSLTLLEGAVDSSAWVKATVRMEAGDKVADYRPRSWALQGDGPSA